MRLIESILIIIFWLIATNIAGWVLVQAVSSFHDLQWFPYWNITDWEPAARGAFAAHTLTLGAAFGICHCFLRD